MNLVKIGGNYFNLDLLASIQPGQKNVSQPGGPVTFINGYYLYFNGWGQPVNVFDPAEVEAVANLLKYQARPLAGKDC